MICWVYIFYLDESELELLNLRRLGGGDRGGDLRLRGGESGERLNDRKFPPPRCLGGLLRHGCLRLGGLGRL